MNSYFDCTSLLMQNSYQALEIIYDIITILSQAREHKFLVRDFVYNPDELQAGKNELTKLATDKKKQFGPLVSKLRKKEGHDNRKLVYIQVT